MRSNQKSVTAARRLLIVCLRKCGVEDALGGLSNDRLMARAASEYGLSVAGLSKREALFSLADQLRSVLKPGDIKRYERKKKKVKPNKVASKAFYSTPEWQQVRYEALRQNDGRCECCGRAKSDGVVLHVDHIKPRSLFPSLSLKISNLQVLCEDCNLGKSNRDDTDWRSTPTEQRERA